MTTSTDDCNEILIVAAEASSSLYALRLLQHWRQSGQNIRAFGIGSRQMQDEGFQIIGRSEELAVVGIQEVIAHFGEIRRTFYSLLDEAKKRKPKVALLLDYPDFNLRLAKKLKAMGISVVYYISPQIWAWRQSRVHTIRERVDKMLVLFPFEKTFYEKFHVPVEFVGHPLLDEIDKKYFSSEYRYQHRAKYGLKEDDLLLALMPGSRFSELKHHLQTQIDTALEVRRQCPQVRVALLVAPTFSVDEIRQRLGALDFPLTLIQDDPFEMIHLADVVLCASGTATLMVGLMQKPMVIMYKMNPLTAFLARRFVTSTKYFGLINLVLDELAVPEYFQQQANAQVLSEDLVAWLTNGVRRQQTSQQLQRAQHCLGDRGVTQRVAAQLQPYFES